MEAVLPALQHKYARDPSPDANVSTAEVAAFVCQFKAASDDSRLMAQIQAAQPEWVLNDDCYAIINAADDCIKLIFKLADLEQEVETALRGAIPLICHALLINPELPLQQGVSILTILDHLSESLLGWTADLGAAGRKTHDSLHKTLQSLAAADLDLNSLESELQAQVEKENKRIQRLESRLLQSETGQLRAQQSRDVTTRMINRAMSNKRLTENIVSFLQGPWYDSLQLLVLQQGAQSDDWQRAIKITETIVWTYQPINAEQNEDGRETQRLYRIIESLPHEVKSLLFSLEHNTEATETALNGIEADHVCFLSGEEPEYCDFELLPEVENAIETSQVSRILLRKVDRLNPGQWFTVEEGDSTVRVKLVLKLDDMRQLVFTNRNGVKVLQKSFEQFAYYLASHMVRPLNQEVVFSSTFRTFFTGVKQEYQRYLKQADARRHQIDALDADRQEQLEITPQAEELPGITLATDGLEEAFEIASREENIELLKEYRIQVAKLATGAMVKLPTSEGDIEECKLAVKIASINKMIFVNAQGIKLGEYSNDELAALLVAEMAAISDAGVEFEDTLAQVVTKLRQDRNKSYDDLTGK